MDAEGRVGQHDEYGKRILRESAGRMFDPYGASVEVDYGAGKPARIDGTVAGKVAVEVASRVAKQVRDAVLDLLCHDYPKKLLLLLPVHMFNAEITAHQCRSALRKFVPETDFRVVVLHGHGSNPKPKEEVTLVRVALRELRAVDRENSASFHST